MMDRSKVMTQRKGYPGPPDWGLELETNNPTSVKKNSFLSGLIINAAWIILVKAGKSYEDYTFRIATCNVRYLQKDLREVKVERWRQEAVDR
jgi:hypothetical protein